MAAHELHAMSEVRMPMTYEQHRANLIEGLKMQTELQNWVKVAALADDLRVLEAQHTGVCHDT